MRDSGIEVIGRAPWGTHFCQFYDNKQDLLEILVQYFAAGLRDNECCMWVTSAPLEVEEAQRALERVVGDLDPFLRSGQLQVLDYTEWYTLGGVFEADRVLQGWLKKLDEARARGFEGLRLSGDLFWIDKETWADFTEYEASIDRAIGGQPIMVLCTYSLAKCGVAEILDVVANHVFALIKQGDAWCAIESTERKRAEEALRQRDEMLEAFFASSPGVLCLVDDNFRYLKTDSMTPTYFGLDRQSIVGKAVQDLAPQCIEDYGSTMRQVLETGIPVLNAEAKSPLPGRQGEVAYWRASCFPVPLPGGKRGNGIIGVDITDIKKAEVELRRREALYRTIARSLPDGYVCVVDRDLRYLVAEGPLLAKIGLRKEQLEGTVVGQAVGETLGRELEPRWRLALSGQTASYETEYGGRALLSKYVPIADDAGVPFGAMSITTDVTGYRAANRALEEALAREKRLARENEEARAHLVKLLAHEIRNPMAGLKGLAQLTERRTLDEKGREMARLMACEVDRLSRILTEVLDAFRAHSGGLQLEAKPVDLAQVISAAVHFCQSRGSHVYEVQLDVPTPATVMGDAVRLEDVIRNLCYNAEKYSATGTTIRIGLAVIEGRARVSVQDEGVGIPQGEVGRVFEEFFRASNVAFRGPGGTGLGLYLCKSVVERHGGRIWVESQEGHGSTFIVELPLACARDRAVFGCLAAVNR